MAIGRKSNGNKRRIKMSTRATLKQMAYEQYFKGVNLYKQGVRESNPSLLIQGSLLMWYNKSELKRSQLVTNKYLNENKS